MNDALILRPAMKYAAVVWFLKEILPTKEYMFLPKLLSSCRTDNLETSELPFIGRRGSWCGFLSASRTSAQRRRAASWQPAFLEVMPGTASPGHFELLLCHLLLSSPFFMSFPLKCQKLDPEFLLNHHLVLRLAKKSEHLAQHFLRAEYFFLPC